MGKGREEEREKKEQKNPTFQVFLTISHHPHVLFFLLGSASSKIYPNLATSFCLHYYLSSLEHHIFFSGAFHASDWPPISTFEPS